MIKLYGFAASNYYNKVKLALLEKGVSFSEELNWAGKDEGTLAMSPLGKVPFIVTPDGAISESEVINQYIEEAYPANPLMPAGAFERAKVRELTTFIELHLELVARRLYPEAFFGGKVSDETKADVRRQLERHVAAIGALTKFAPFVSGTSFNLADCAAIVHFPLVSSATKAIYGEDLLAPLSGLRDYLKAMSARASVVRVNADRKANLEAMAARAR